MSDQTDTQAAALAEMTTRAETAEAEALAATARAEAAEQALAEHQRTARLSAVQATFQTLGRTLSDEEAAPYLDLSEAAWARVSADLAAARPHAAEHLFSEQATGEPGGQAPNLNLSAIYAARRGEVN